MLARLTIHLPFQPSRSFLLDGGAETIVGRDASCDIVIEDDRVSRRHARLAFGSSGWRLADLGSTNGTAVQGTPVDEAALSADDWISFGGLPARFEHSSSERERARALRREERFRSSISLQKQLDPMLGTPELLDRLLASILTLSATERGFVLLANDAGQMEIAATRGVSDADLASEEFSGSGGAIERAAASRRPVAVSDVLADPFLASRESVIRGGIRALICLPLVALDRLTGVIYADNRSPGTTFGDLDVEILDSLAAHAALAVLMARRDRELRALAATLPRAEISEPALRWADVLARRRSMPGEALS